MLCNAEVTVTTKENNNMSSIQKWNFQSLLSSWRETNSDKFFSGIYVIDKLFENF